MIMSRICRTFLCSPAMALWGHYYVFCYSNPAKGSGGTPCTGNPAGWSGAGGTSFATPIVAGVQALVNQSRGSRQGNPNYVYYALAKMEIRRNRQKFLHRDAG